jgi:SCA7, zinc-binding domain
MDHIRKCLVKKQAKLQKKKEAREAKGYAMRKARNGGISPEPSGRKGADDKKRKATDDGDAPTSKRKKKEPKPKTGKLKGPVDVEKQCGVPLPNGLMCARSLTCKSHSMGAKRAVMGRSMRYDVLLAQYQKRNHARQHRECAHPRTLQTDAIRRCDGKCTARRPAGASTGRFRRGKGNHHGCGQQLRRQRSILGCHFDGCSTCKLGPANSSPSSVRVSANQECILGGHEKRARLQHAGLSGHCGCQSRGDGFRPGIRDGRKPNSYICGSSSYSWAPANEAAGDNVPAAKAHANKAQGSESAARKGSAVNVAATKASVKGQGSEGAVGEAAILNVAAAEADTKGQGEAPTSKNTDVNVTAV